MQVIAHHFFAASSSATNCSKMYMLSQGPGAASEWYWIVRNGSRVPRRPSHGAVVEVDVADLDAVRQAFAVDRVAVVLRRDVHAARRDVAYRVVGAAVAERQLVRLRAEGAARDLVAQADAEDRHAADEALHRIDDVVELQRVAGAGR